VIPNARIMSAVRRYYGLGIKDIQPVSSGEDRDSIAYRAAAINGKEYFLKLRGKGFLEASVIVPKHLADVGVRAAIPPVETPHGDLWVDLGALKLVIYPFIQGPNGYEKALTDSQWHDLGRDLKMIHQAEIPADLSGTIREETSSSRWGRILQRLLEQVGGSSGDDPVTEELVRFLAFERESLLDICRWADRLGEEMVDRPLKPVLCHADVHAGNVLIDPAGNIYLVDWEDTILAPKERDLMFIGGGYWGGRRRPEQEEALFYHGYGSPQIDWVTLAYYRYSRIVEDIAIFCERILRADEGRADRERCLRHLRASLLPNGTIEMARRTIQGWRGHL
jgi:spectinomycin phosphotransferase